MRESRGGQCADRTLGCMIHRRVLITNAPHPLASPPLLLKSPPSACIMELIPKLWWITLHVFHPAGLIGTRTCGQCQYRQYHLYWNLCCCCCFWPLIYKNTCRKCWCSPHIAIVKKKCGMGGNKGKSQRSRGLNGTALTSEHCLCLQILVHACDII